MSVSAAPRRSSTGMLMRSSGSRAFSYFQRVRSLICGHPIVIIKDGKMIDAELKRLRISYEDVYSLLREQEISDESNVRYGIIEPNGSLSVLTDENLAHNGIQSAELQDELRYLSEEAKDKKRKKREKTDADNKNRRENDGTENAEEAEIAEEKSEEEET